MSTTTARTSERIYDAIIMGGGPAGALSALRLAKAGRSVLLLEKAQFPRFHIGESLVPYFTKTLENLGLLDDVKRGPYLHKRAIEINFGGQFRRATFAQLAPGQIPLAFNLERASFDKLLLDAARAAGAVVLEECEVRRLLFEGDRLVGVTYLAHEGADEEAGEARGRFIIDATGRAGVIAHHFRMRKMNPRLENMAIYRHYVDLVAANNPSDPADLILDCQGSGWLWAIPVDGGKALSVGVVVPAKALKDRTAREVHNEYVSRAARINARVEGARLLSDNVRVESDFCYHSERLAGPGFFIVGDAGCFVDPLFSGGLFLGAMTGIKAADMVDAVLGGADEIDARRRFENFSKTGYDSYFRLIYAFYFGCEGNVARMFGAFPGGFHFAQQTLCGDFWGLPDQPVLKTLRAEPSYATFEEPFEYVYECPLYPGIAYSGTNLPPPDPFAH